MVGEVGGRRGEGGGRREGGDIQSLLWLKDFLSYESQSQETTLYIFFSVHILITHSLLEVKKKVISDAEVFQTIDRFTPGICLV